MKNLGRLAAALPLYQRAKEITLSREDWDNASTNYRNLADLYVDLGQIAASADAARDFLTLARRAENKEGERYSLAHQAWVAYLQGDLETAGALFQEALEREINPDKRYLYAEVGIWHADCLRRSHDPGYARQVTEANLEACQRDRWLDTISLCHRVLGDLDADAGEHESARKHYNEALKIARGISEQEALIEALLGRGRWAARQGELEIAAQDLEEALSYAVAGGYRIYEADIRVGLAWLHLAEGNRSAAREQAERAQRASEEMGYHWGQVDAAEVLG